MNHAILGSAFNGNQASLNALKATYGWEQFEQDRAALDRLIFVYHADRLRALVEDNLRVFLEDDPVRILKVDSSIESRIPKKVNAKSISGLVEQAGDRLTRGSIKKVQRRFYEIFGVSLFSDAEIAYLNYVFSLRNMLVHRSEVADGRFLRETNAGWKLGEEVAMPSIARLGRKTIGLPYLLSRRLSGHDSARASLKYCRGNI